MSAAAAAAILLVRLPDAFHGFDAAAAGGNDEGGVLAAADSVNLDNDFVPATLQVTPADARFAVVVPDATRLRQLHEVNPITVQAAPLILESFLLPRRWVPAPERGAYLVCFLCNATVLLLNVVFLVAGNGVLWGIRGWRSWGEYGSLAGVAYVLGLCIVTVLATLVPIYGGSLGVGTVMVLGYGLAAAGTLFGVARRRPLPGRPSPYLVAFVLGLLGWSWVNWSDPRLPITTDAALNPTGRAVGSLVLLSIVAAPVLIGRLLAQHGRDEASTTVPIASPYA